MHGVHEVVGSSPASPTIFTIYMTHSFSIGVFLNILQGSYEEVQTQIAHIRSLENVDHIEIWREAEILDPKITEALISLASDYRLIVHAPFIGLSLSGHDQVAKASVQVLQNFYNWGLEIGARVFTIHGGNKPFYQTVAIDVDSIVRNLSQLTLQPSLKCTLEHMPASKNFSTAPVSIISLEELEQAVNRLPDFGFTVDIGHVIQNEEKWEEWMERNLNRVYDIHFHDAFLGGKAHLPLGTADFKCAEFFDFLDKHNYQQFLSLEVVGPKAIADSWAYLKINNLV